MNAIKIHIKRKLHLKIHTSCSTLSPKLHQGGVCDSNGAVGCSHQVDSHHVFLHGIHKENQNCVLLCILKYKDNLEDKLLECNILWLHRQSNKKNICLPCSNQSKDIGDNEGLFPTHQWFSVSNSYLWSQNELVQRYWKYSKNFKIIKGGCAHFACAIPISEISPPPS